MSAEGDTLLDIPEGDEWQKAKQSWEDHGYAVLGLCSWCQWGFVVESPNLTHGRRYCTAYGQCEAAPG